MKIESIRLRNYRCHEDLTVEFKSNFTALAAVNGGGKTSLLRGIADSLPWVVSSLVSQNGYWSLQVGTESPVRAVVHSFDGRYRFEEVYPLTIDVEAIVLGDKRISWSVTKSSQLTAGNFIADVDFHTWISARNNGRQDGHDTAALLPLVAFYRANRQWVPSAVADIVAAMDRNSRADALANWHDASLDTAALQRWVISKSLERLETSVERQSSFSDVSDDDLAAVNHAIHQVINDAKGLRYDLKRKALLMEWTDERRNPTAFENLSDGQRAIICLVADIARRACLANPMLGVDAPAKTTGVVLIDELDVHLHPHWQRLITRGLKQAFPALQFIVATHSPQILGELHPEEVLLLRRDGPTHPQVSYGLTSAQVLEIIMETDPRTSLVDGGLARIFEFIERGELEEARHHLNALENQAPDLPELDGVRAALRRKELLGI